MTAETFFMAVAIGVVSSLLTAIFFCIVFYRMGPNHDDTEDILDGLREPQWKVTEDRKPKEARHE